MRGNQRLIHPHLSPWICDSCRLRRSAFTSQQSRSFATSHRQYSKAKSTPHLLPDAPARTRFAPSPTGNLHLGSIRTALFNFLLAKRTNGKFLLRIEDTDRKRTVPGAEERLFRDLRWAGLGWDEGPEVDGPHGPYRQSERLPIYHQHITQLLEHGHAYRCFCSPERLDKLNRMRHDKGLPLGYDRRCIDIDPAEAEGRAERGDANIVRFKMPLEWPRYKDLIFGDTGHGKGRSKKSYIDDPVYDDAVLMKSDGFPTYHFANVVDDHLMHISHVIRGSEWMSSTPLHVALYNAFGWRPPHFGHVPLLIDQNKQKLSKRNLDSDISSFRDKMRIFPETLTNFSALLGWSHKQRSDVLDLHELQQTFDLKITKGNTMVAFEKLWFLQEAHARRRIQTAGLEFEQMIRDVAQALLDKYGAAVVTNFIRQRKLQDVIATFLSIEKLPYRTPEQYVDQLDMFLTSRYVDARPPIEAVIPDTTQYKSLRIALGTLTLIPERHWNHDTLKQHLQDVINVEDTSLPSSPSDAKDIRTFKSNLYKCLRWAILGGAHGPDMPTSMELLAKGVCEARIRESVFLLKEVETANPKPLVEPIGVTKEPWKAHTMPKASEKAV